MAKNAHAIHKKMLRWMLAFALVLCVPAHEATAKPNAAPKKAVASPSKKTPAKLDFSTSLQGNYARITLKSPSMPLFEVSQKSQSIILTFDAPYAANTDSIVMQLHPFISTASMSEDGKTLTLTTDKQYGNRPFMSDDGSGVDVMNIEASRSKPLDKAPEKKPDTTANTEPTEKKDTQESPASISNAKEMVSITSDTLKTALKTLQDGDMMVGVRQGHGGAEFSFPWKKRVASAAYMRGKNLWVVFNDVMNPHVDVLKTILPPFIDEVENIPVAGYTVLRFHSNLNMFASVRRATDSYEWVVTMTRRGHIPATIIPVKLQGQKTNHPYFQVDILQAAEPVDIPDPVTGDKLVVLPDYEPSEGVFPQRSFVDFNLLRTAQGVVIERNNDELKVVKLRAGIKITTQGNGLNISATLPEFSTANAAMNEENSHTFYPYDHWKQGDYKEYVAKRQHIASDMLQATDEDAVKFRMRLAGLALGNDMYPEALGQLNEIKQRQPKFYEDYQLAALRGATNFMMQRYRDAAADFSDPSLENEDEIDFWRGATEMMLGTNEKVLDYMGFHENYAKLYPPRMRQRLAMLAIDQAMSRTRYNDAKRIVMVLFNESTDKKNVNPYLQDYIDFVSGRIYLATGNVERGKEILDKLITTSNNPYFRANAQYVLSVAQYEAGQIKRDELIKQLDPLRIVWRGDAFEVTLLNLLGDLYTQEGRSIDGMRAWNELVKQYPDAPEALDVAQKMAESFVKLFNEGEADKLKPLEALALYYEFQSLTPVGKDGDKMIQNLADRLASVDLLDRAAALLAYQIKYRLEKEERSRVGARLGLLYLLNKEPEKALDALKLTGFGNNPEDLDLQRAHLSAEAYHQVKEDETALKILKDDFSDDAKAIKLGIYWDQKDWKNVAITAEDMLANRKDITAPLNEAEAQTLLRLGVSYTFLDDTKQLSYLRDYFTPLMEKNPLKDSFMFITNDTGPITHNNIDKLSDDLNKMKLFISSYQKQVHDTGLSKAVK